MTTALLRSLNLAAALLVASPTLAADRPIEAEGMLDWSGPWLGVRGSTGWMEGDGVPGGLVESYDWRLDRPVGGFDSDLMAGGIDARRLRGRFEIESPGGVRGRVGYAFDRFVAFGAASAAFASAEFARAGERDPAFGWTMTKAVADVATTGALGSRLVSLYVDLDRRAFYADREGLRAPGQFAPSDTTDGTIVARSLHTTVTNAR